MCSVWYKCRGDDRLINRWNRKHTEEKESTMTRKKANRYVSAIIFITITCTLSGCGTFEAIGKGVEALGTGIGRDVQGFAQGARNNIADSKQDQQ